jgi:hypothetical protein
MASATPAGGEGSRERTIRVALADDRSREGDAHLPGRDELVVKAEAPARSAVEIVALA